jgi:signal transduction histidine kinase
MAFISKKINLKNCILIVFILAVFLLFLINSWLVDALRTSVSKTAKSYKTFIEGIINQEKLSDYPTIAMFNNLIRETDIPIIIKRINPDEVYTNSSHFDNMSMKQVEESINEMKKVFSPLPIFIKEGDKIIISQKLFYGDTNMIKVIQLIPYIQICLIFFISILSLIYFSSSRKNLQNALYVGIFKETAHQLGTPISSLMGWIENMKSNKKGNDTIKFIEQDLEILKEISNRFNKIGSKVKLSKINLSGLLDQISDYIILRTPKTKDIKILNDYDRDILIDGEKVLLSWAFENLIKNSIQSIKGNQGLIKITVIQKDKLTKLLFEDSGIGINRKDWKNIFLPGYSTKASGWGVGLSLTKRIICEIHNGKIFVRKSSSIGTTIEINI